MQTVNVPVDRLLGILKDNRQKHEAIYNEALTGFRVDAIEKLVKQLKAAKAGEKIEMTLGLVEPVSQVKDYDRVIAMLELTNDSVVSLTSQEFAQYVQDEWYWKDTFTASNSRYLGKTGR